MGRPIVISFEGIDGCGKTTQAEMLEKELKDLNINVQRLGFPDRGDTVSGSIIRSHLAGRWSAVPTKMDIDRNDLNASVFQMIQVVNRMEQLPPELWSDFNSLFEERFLILDRYKMSGEVYGSVDGLSRRWIQNIQQHLPSPELTIVLDLEPKVSLQRLKDRAGEKDRYEVLPQSVFERQAEIYRGFASDRSGKVYNQHGRVVMIDADSGVHNLSKAILGQMVRLINEELSIDTGIRERLNRKLLERYTNYCIRS